MADPLSGKDRLRLAEAGGEELLQLLRRGLARLDVPALRAVLKNPHLSTEMVELLLSERRLLAFSEARRELARCPSTPRTAALSLLPALSWRDLVEVSRDVRVAAVVRHSAERHLAERMPQLAEGERIAIARRASPGLIQVLRGDGSPRVVSALMDNPRLTLGLLMPLVGRSGTPPPVLAAVARHRVWGRRHEVQVGLCRNPRTPVAEALALLPGLTKWELRPVSRDRRLPIPVRRRAALLCGEIDHVDPGSRRS